MFPSDHDLNYFGINENSNSEHFGVFFNNEDKNILSIPSYQNSQEQLNLNYTSMHQDKEEAIDSIITVTQGIIKELYYTSNFDELIKYINGTFPNVK